MKIIILNICLAFSLIVLCECQPSSLQFSGLPTKTNTQIFLRNLIFGRFSIDSYNDYLQNLTINPENDNQTKTSIATVLDLMDFREDVIRKSVYRFFNIKHGTGDMDKALLLNMKVFFLKRLIQLVPQDDTGLKNFILSLRPNGSEMVWDFNGNLPNFLLFIPFGVDQAYYTDFSKLNQVSLENLQSVNFNGFQPGTNLEPFARFVPLTPKVCGSCMAFASAAVLSNFYVRQYFHHFNISAEEVDNFSSQYNFTQNPFFVDAYQLLACANYERPVPEKDKLDHQILFPKSNGFYEGHGCYGNMSPEMLFWAQHNKEKIGIFDDILDKIPNFNTSVYNYEIRLGGYCDEITQKVKKIDDPLIPFPDFNIKYVPKELFQNQTKKEIAERLMRLVLKYGFVFISLYYDSGSFFECVVLDQNKDSMETYHYVALTGVEHIQETDEYNILIQNSWGETDYRRAQIIDNYVICNALNAIMVIEPK